MDSETEAEAGYQEAQKRPLFQRATEMIPREVVDARSKDYECYNHIKRACNIPKRERHLPYCAVCYCAMSYGSEFYERRAMLTTDEVFAMNGWQKEKIL